MNRRRKRKKVYREKPVKSSGQGNLKYTGRQVAEKIGCTPETIARWRKLKLIPSRRVLKKNVQVFMYTEADLALIHRAAKRISPGRGNKAVDVNLTKIIPRSPRKKVRR